MEISFKRVHGVVETHEVQDQSFFRSVMSRVSSSVEYFRVAANNGTELFQNLATLKGLSFPLLSDFQITFNGLEDDFVEMVFPLRAEDFDMPDAKIELVFLTQGFSDMLIVAELIKLFGVKIVSLDAFMSALSFVDESGALAPEYDRIQRQFVDSFSYCVALRSLRVGFARQNKPADKFFLFTLFLNVLENIPARQKITTLGLFSWMDDIPSDVLRQRFMTILESYDCVEHFVGGSHLNLSPFKESLLAHFERHKKLKEVSWTRGARCSDWRDLQKLCSIPQLQSLHLECVDEGWNHVAGVEQSYLEFSKALKFNMTLKQLSFKFHVSSVVCDKIMQAVSENRTIQMIDIQANGSVEYMEDSLKDSFLNRGETTLKNPCLTHFSFQSFERDAVPVNLFPTQIQINQKFINFISDIRALEKKVNYLLEDAHPSEYARRMARLDHRVFFLFANTFHLYQKTGSPLLSRYPRSEEPLWRQNSEKKVIQLSGIFKEFALSLLFTTSLSTNLDPNAHPATRYGDVSWLDDLHLWLRILSYLDYPSVGRQLQLASCGGLFFRTWKSMQSPFPSSSVSQPSASSVAEQDSTMAESEFCMLKK